MCDNKTRRNFCFTIYDLKAIPKLSKKVRYVKWQLEVCPTTDREHYQGWCQLSVSTRPSAIQKEWGNKFHFEECNGDENANERYCGKWESRIDGPWELGDMVVQGTRSDIGKVVDDILENKNDYYIVQNHAKTFVKYSRGFEKVKSIHLRQDKSFRKLQVNVLWGDAGSGKTRKAVESVKDDDYYILGNDADTVWWDGYDGEKTLIIDDFYGWIKYASLLRVLDGYQMRLPIKGGFTYARWETVWITSNKDPADWYSVGLTPALKRRVTNVTMSRSEG